MPKATDPFVEHCLELLAPLGAVRVRRMFGGWGFYADDLFFALIAFDRLYLKTDAAGRERHAAAGGEPFVYSGNGKTVTMAYWTVPAEAMESPALMQPWARLALAAALAARGSTPARSARGSTSARSARGSKPARSPRRSRPSRSPRHKAATRRQTRRG